MASQALATRENTAVAQQNDNPLVRFRGQLEQRAAEFKMVLPAHITPEKLQRTVLTAVQGDPDLLRADRQSLLTSCMKAAQDGLLPDKREAALVIFSTRQKDGQGAWQNVKLVQYMPMVFGLRKKILQSGEISSIETNVVYRREVEEGYFVFEAGTEAMLRHKPMLDLTDEDLADENIVAAYSVAVMKDGTKSFEVMRRAEINKVRQKSQTGAEGQIGKFGAMKGKPVEPKGPWVDWFSEMARKTVMRRHSKTLPMSGDILDVEDRDDARYAASATAALGMAEADAPTPLPPTRDDLAHDLETGEIVNGRSEEEIARELDGQTDGWREGRPDDEYGEDTGDARRTLADDLIARLKRAEILGDVTAAERELTAHRDAMPADLVDLIDAEIATAKARVGRK